MYDDTLPAQHNATDRVRAVIVGALKRALAAYRRRREVARLAELSDHVLRDIGLTHDQAVVYRLTVRPPR